MKAGFIFSLFLLFSLSYVVSSAPSDTPARAVFRPRDRFPVHFKGKQNEVKKSSEKISDEGTFSSLPPIKEVTKDSSEFRAKPTVKIFEIGTGPTAPTPPRPQVSSDPPRSLLDDTEAFDPNEPIPTQSEYEAEENNLQEDNVNHDKKSEKESVNEAEEQVGQETFHGTLGIRAPTTVMTPAFTRAPYSSRIRPSGSLFLKGPPTTPFIPLLPGPTVTVPVQPRPPIPPPGGTEVPILGGIGPSPPISSILPPPPPPPNSAVRSLFGNSGIRTVPSRRPVNRGVVNTRLVSPVSGTRAGVGNSDPNVITDYVFSDIKCYRTKQKEYFGAKIHMKSGYHAPYIRDRPQDPMTSSDCQMEQTSEPNTYHMKMMDLRGCGVEQCGDSMCITMVFPRVPTLALADDEVTTIKCQPMKNTMSELKTISFAGDSLENRRSGSTVEGGGQEFAAEVGVFRQNPGTSNGLFVKRVNSGGVVQLGEPLQLRSVVRGGDGWTFSKLTDVKVWRMRDTYAPNMDTLNPGDASEVITLVDGKGCRNSEYRVIAEADPLRDPRNDLVHHFTFKAFLFRGQRANEPLIVTAKVQACQDRDDCDFYDCGGTRSGDGDRYKRSLFDEESSTVSKNGTSMNWSSHLALRVVGFKDQSSSISETDFIEHNNDPITIIPTNPPTCQDKMALSFGVGGFLAALVIILVYTLVSFFRRGKKIESNVAKAASYIHQLEDSDRQVRRTTSNSTNPDFVRRLEAANKPLPPIPTTSGVQTNPKSSPVAKLLQQLSEGGTEYECVDRKNTVNNEDEDDDGVYVLYYKRSRSAPGSLRESNQRHHRSSRRGVVTDAETGDSDDEIDFNYRHSIGPRRTVRSVKKRSHRRQKMRERKGIPSVYRGDKGLRGSRTSIHINHDDEGQSDVQVMSDSAISTSSSTTSTSPNTSSSSSNTTTHFVTRNDSSTQIIIIPETNV